MNRKSMARTISLALGILLLTPACQDNQSRPPDSSLADAASPLDGDHSNPPDDGPAAGDVVPLDDVAPPDDIPPPNDIPPLDDITPDDIPPLGDLAPMDDLLPPIAQAGPDMTVTINQTFTLDASASRDDGPIINYSWNLAEGPTLSGITISHSYPTPGDRTVTLTVTDSAGRQASDTLTIHVLDQIAIAGLIIRPPSIVLSAPGASTPLQAMARLTDNSIVAVAATWSVIDPAIGQISPSGLLTALADGETTIFADASGAQAQASLTVGPDFLAANSLSHDLTAIRSQGQTSSPLEGSALDGIPSFIRVRGAEAYVVLSDKDQIAVIDIPTLTRARTIDLATQGANPWDILFHSDDLAYVSHLNKEALTTLNPLTGEILGEIPLPNDSALPLAPEGMALDRDLLFVASTAMLQGPGAILVIDLTRGQALDTPLAVTTPNPQTLHIDPRGYLLVVSTGDYSGSGGALEVFDTLTLAPVAHIPLGVNSAPVSLAQAEGRVYMGDAMGPYIYSVSPQWTALRTSADPIALPTRADGYHFVSAISVTPDGRLLALDFNEDRLHTMHLADDADAGPVPFTAMVDLSGGGRPGAQYMAPLMVAPEARFFDRVVDYTPPGPPPFDDPERALGGPRGRGCCQGSEDVVSLAEGGYLTLAMDGARVVDGAGPDLVVFENTMYVGTDRHNRFMELATLEVSADGEIFLPFPTREDPSQGDTSPLRYPQGYIGVHPVFANVDENSIDPASPAAGGDRFDLADVGLSFIRYVRIRDTEGHGTADIDAVGALHFEVEP